MVMRMLLLVFLCCVFAWSAAAAPVQRTLSFGGFQRSYVVHVPARMAGQDVALVVVLHGLGGDGANVLAQGRWVEKANVEGFIVVAPEGIPEDPTRPARFFGNKRSWNSGPATGSPAEARGVDDVRFIAAVIQEVRRQHRVDGRRIHVTGFSNGAGMAFRVGAELPDVVASIAPVANGLLLPVEALERPVSLMLVWGMDDPLNPVTGGKVRRSGQEVLRPSAEGSWRQWARLLRCPAAPVVDRSVPRVIRQAFEGCADGSTAVLVGIEGLGHQWPGGKVVLRLVSGPGSDAFDATTEIWKFFAAHRRLR
jgi:polyhydroxybutyrate depolymerase